MDYWEKKIRESAKEYEGELAHGSIYSLLREMQVGDRLLVPFEMEKSVRPSASQIKKEFGARYQIKRLYTVHGVKYILAKRTL